MSNVIPAVGGTQVVTVIQQQPVVAPAHTRGGARIYENYSGQSSINLGATQITIGILCIVFNVVAMILGAAHSAASTGIWCGAFFILTGSFGVGAGKERTSCPIVAFMVLSIIAAVLTVFLLGFSWGGASQDNMQCIYFCLHSSERAAKVAMNALQALLAILEAVVAIWSSAICCGATCCGQRQNGRVLQTVRYNQGPQTVHIINPGQPMNVMYQHPQQQQQMMTWSQPQPNMQTTYMQQQGPAEVHFPSPPSYMAAPPAYQPAGAPVGGNPSAGASAPYQPSGAGGFPPSAPAQAFADNKGQY